MFSITKFLFRLIPWWVFAFFAVTNVPAVVAAITTGWTEWTHLDGAAQTAGPDPVPMADFVPSAHVATFGEVAISNLTLVEDIPRSMAMAGSEDELILLLEADLGGTVALVTPAGTGTSAIEQLAIDADTGHVTVRGFWIDPNSTTAAAQAARRMVSGTVPVPVVMIDPFTGPRIDVFQSKQNGVLFVVIAAAIVQISLIVATVVKYRHTKARRAARTGATAAALWDGTPATAVQTAPQPPAPRRVGYRKPKRKDKFDDGPIVSRKGWFG